MDAIIVLGAAVWKDGPSPALRRRTLHAASLWLDRQAPIIIPCGGLGLYPPTEAALMKTLLEQHGVNPDCILPEDQSPTTLENIRNARELLTGRAVIVVTDRYHARRAAMVARHFGFNATVSSPRPNRSHLKQHLREAIALPAYAIKLRKTPRQP